MDTIAVDVKRVDPSSPASSDTTPGRSALEADVARVRALATWLDAQFEVAGVKFGFDAIIGLIPGVGDTVTSLIALYPIYVAKRHGLGRSLQMRMAFNVFMDWLPGMVPVLGDAIDVLYKANLKNLKLLEKAVEQRRAEGK